ncbi:hypothetical protein [Piscirickettsia salmonis]|uniref:hypothetical protein n=2 Tax=Piscirickettsia salmonis TaxID=1238 RepID=UPI000AF8B6DB|nr:hypothetical protein [Piscirickettsia salmonis]QGO72639.1 hypothetical protein Psal098_00594 [Piscirickettsia salmonis]QGO76125.1 hypothetical protein Psal099_00594 [Piscirickettsia salmonis]QGP07489.1 hypothetical protein Psal134_00594 [Piscirickettsia salmonis]QGP11007.1 hypothetical protein Psal135_00595 [Piscirickettsia salmonis]QGP14509.1 hypothetical protein Psal138_00594 [Piscirickettsia salmonis]
MLSSSRYSLDTQRKSDAAPYCKSMKEVCRLAFFKDPYDPYEPDSLTSVEHQLKQPCFDLLAAEVGGASTGFISAYAGPDSRKQSFKSFVEQLHCKAINPVEIFLTKSIRELEKYANNQSKPSFMDSSHAARRQFARREVEKLKSMLIVCESMTGTPKEVEELQAIFVKPILPEFSCLLKSAKEMFWKRGIRGLGAVLKQFEKSRQALCLSTSVAEFLERGHEEGLQPVSLLQSDGSSFRTAEVVRPARGEDTQHQPVAFVPFEVGAPGPGA